MVDETKPPKGWVHTSIGSKEAGWTHGWSHAAMFVGTLAEAHRIAREEASPCVADALERIAAWLEFRAFEECREQLAGRFDRWLSRQVAAMARGERPVPGSGEPRQAAAPTIDDVKAPRAYRIVFPTWDGQICNPRVECYGIDQGYGIDVPLHDREECERAIEAHRAMVLQEEEERRAR